jgi:hypothetical protein
MMQHFTTMCMFIGILGNGWNDSRSGSQQVCDIAGAYLRCVDGLRACGAEVGCEVHLNRIP